MEQKEGNLKSESSKAVTAALRRALEGFGGALLRVCEELTNLKSENADLKARLADVELAIADLSSRMDNADLRAGLKPAVSPLGKLTQIEPAEGNAEVKLHV